MRALDGELWCGCGVGVSEGAPGVAVGPRGEAEGVALRRTARRSGSAGGGPWTLASRLVGSTPRSGRAGRGRGSGGAWRWLTDESTRVCAVRRCAARLGAHVTGSHASRRVCVWTIIREIIIRVYIPRSIDNANELTRRDPTSRSRVPRRHSPLASRLPDPYTRTPVLIRWPDSTRTLTE